MCPDCKKVIEQGDLENSDKESAREYNRKAQELRDQGKSYKEVFEILGGSPDPMYLCPDCNKEMLEIEIEPPQYEGDEFLGDYEVKCPICDKDMELKCIESMKIIINGEE